MLMHKQRIAMGVAVVAGALTLAACGSGSGGSTTTPPSDSKPTGSAPTTASSMLWPAPADAAAQVKAAGLPMLGQEGQVLHIHSHLDVIVDGKPVTVPAEIGIDLVKQQISPLHTHDTSGVVHIESPEKKDFTLGQFMTEWNVPISKDALGPLKTGGSKELHVYVNGTEQTGDPAALKLASHAEIAVVYGAPGDKMKVPGSYDWPAGL